LAGTPRDGYWGHTLGSAWGDVDNDGDLDLFSCNLAHERYSYISNRSQLLVNGGGETTLFADERAARGIGYSETNTDPVLADFNHDGYLDLFFTANYANRPSFLYLNDGQGSFHDVTFLAGARLANCYGCATADVDLDGDLDLLLASSAGSHLLVNESPPQHWLGIRLVGGMREARQAAGDGLGWSNSDCFGARVTVRAGKELFTRELQSCRGVGSEDEPVLNFGLGGRSGPVDIEVHYPSGRQWRTSVSEVDGIYTFHETAAAGTSQEQARPTTSRSWGG
jgi:hypothetical protein